MNFSLTPQLEIFVREQAAMGDYNNASEVVREALRLFKRREEERQLKISNLRQAIKTGDDAIKKGDFVALDSNQAMDDFFEAI